MIGRLAHEETVCASVRSWVVHVRQAADTRETDRGGDSVRAERGALNADVDLARVLNLLFVREQTCIVRCEVWCAGGGSVPFVNYES